MNKAGKYTSFSPIDDRFDHHRKGIFNCTFKHQKLYLVLFPLGMAIILGLIFAVDTSTSNLAGIIYSFIRIGAMIVSPFILIAGIRIILSGAQFSYTADDQKMLIVCPRENYRADIFYNTVVSVSYEDMKRFSRKTGFHVTVFCTYGEYHFEYLFPYKVSENAKTPEITPFRLLEERAGLITPPEYYMGKGLDNF